MIKIRDASILESEIIINFQTNMALETENLKLEKSSVRKGINAVFKDSSKGKYYVAEENDRIVGSLLTTFEWSDWKNGIILWIQSVYIIPEYRRKGIFKKMYSYLKKMVEESNGLIGLRLYVNKTNIIAQKTYEKIGMDSEHYKLYEWIK